MKLTADKSGIVAGKLNIPSNIPAGMKEVVVTGKGGSAAAAIYSGSNTLTENTYLEAIHIAPRSIDPVAQTFKVDKKCQITHIDLFFTARGDTTIVVQVRTVENGIPTGEVIAETACDPAHIVINAYNRFHFDWPVTLAPEAEYAFVVMADDDVSAIAVAEMGKWDANDGHGHWVTSQPYTVGVLLTSANASTWTPHQTIDVNFRLLSARYNPVVRDIEAGSVEVNEASDLMVVASILTPDDSTHVEFLLDLPGGVLITASNRQPIKLATPVTGTVKIIARLYGSERFSPTVLRSSIQLLAGAIQTSADYVSRAMPAGPGSRINIIADACLPSGSTLSVDYAEFNTGETGDPAWQEITAPTKTFALDGNWTELTFEYAAISKDFVRVRLRLSGSAAARPYVSNLRMMVM